MAENPCKCSDVLLNSLSREGRSLTAASHSSDSARRAYTLILPNTLYGITGMDRDLGLVPVVLAYRLGIDPRMP